MEKRIDNTSSEDMLNEDHEFIFLVEEADYSSVHCTVRTNIACFKDREDAEKLADALRKEKPDLVYLVWTLRLY